MSFQGGRIQSHHVRSILASTRHRQSHWTRNSERRLLFTHNHASILSRDANVKRSFRRLGNHNNQKRWSTATTGEDLQILSKENMESRRAGSTMIAAISAIFAGIVLVEGNANKGWIGSKTELPRVYSRQAIREYWRQRPVSILRRLGKVVLELGPIWARYIGYQYSPFASKRNPHGIDPELEEQVISKLAKDLKQALTNLGPAWIKGMSF